MRFKQWLQGESGIGTDIINGGVGEAPGEFLNTGMPVKSKISTQDGTEPHGVDSATGKKSPDRVFGFRSLKDKKRTGERESQFIDRFRGGPVDRITPSSSF